MNTLAPIVIFCYRRPEHLHNTLTSLIKCDGFWQSPVIVYCDGSRDTNDKNPVIATRELVKSMLGEHAEYHFSDENLGLSRSIITGVSDTLDRYERAIVIEDDLELSPSFLIYMNNALDRYAHDKNIFQISGYMFNTPELENTSSALFLPFTVSWGWATWKRAWDQFNPLASGWEALRTDKELRHRFNLDGTYDYATMLMQQMAGLRDSWAVRWYWTVFKANGLVLFPPVSLVSNTGFDGSGTHGRGLLRKFSKTKSVLVLTDIFLPESTTLNMEMYVHVKMALRQQNGGWIGKMVDKLRWLKT